MKEASFVREDRALLDERYDVRTFQFAPEKADSAIGLLELWIRQFAWLLRELPKASLVVGWFADHHVALPVLMAPWFGVPSAVILGGMDCNWLPEYNYGVWESRWRAPLVRWIVRRADLLPTVSSSLIESYEQYSQWPNWRRHGIKERVPDLETPHPVIELGFDAAAWPMGPSSRSRTVTTVAYIHSRRTYKIKGIDLLCAAASRLPDTSFRVVGVSSAFEEELRQVESVPSNVELCPPRPRSALKTVYQETSVYAQLSRVEAFGLVVGEAMLSGCVPVVSSVGQLPALVGDAGRVVERPEPDYIAEVLQRALDEAEMGRQRARSRIQTQFSRDRRRTQLIQALDELRL